jgi:5-formyltetrahydrofolate cyclo-ligase
MDERSQRLKVAMRQEVQTRLATFSKQAQEAGSILACERLRGQAVWARAESVLLYAPSGWELDVWSLVREGLASGKQVTLPRFDAGRGQYAACRINDLARDLARGRYGIMEPARACEEVALNRLDLVLVPGVAFDLRGRRLGRGKGYFDRVLAATRGTRCGVAFDEQIVREVPIEPHDSDVNCILTPTRWIEL